MILFYATYFMYQQQSRNVQNNLRWWNSDKRKLIRKNLYLGITLLTQKYIDSGLRFIVFKLSFVRKECQHNYQVESYNISLLLLSKLRWHAKKKPFMNCYGSIQTFYDLYLFQCFASVKLS